MQGVSLGLRASHLVFGLLYGWLTVGLFGCPVFFTFWYFFMMAKQWFLIELAFEVFLFELLMQLLVVGVLWGVSVA